MDISENFLRRYTMNQRKYFLNDKDIVIDNYLFSIYSGWVKIIKIHSTTIKCSDNYIYTKDGRYDNKEQYPSLFSNIPPCFMNPNTFKNWYNGIKVGDRVWSIRYGWAIIKSIEYDLIILDNDVNYSLEGKWLIFDLFPSLYKDIPEIYQLDPIPDSDQEEKDLKVDDDVYVWNDHVKVKRKFAYYDEDDVGVYCYLNGASSLSSMTDVTDVIYWRYYEKIEPTPEQYLKVDDDVYVWNENSFHSRIKLKFSHFDSDGNIQCFCKGVSSANSVSNQRVSYDHYEVILD